jgi:DNA-directed RNA polymerase specialized sigma24 family protein
LPFTIFPESDASSETGGAEWSRVLHASPAVLTQEIGQEEPTLTEVAFTRLLTWLDDGADSRGESYLEMRRRLVAYFDRRNRPAPDALADETLNRISRTLEKSGSIATTPPQRYCYVVARFVLLEDLRRERRYVPFDNVRHAGTEWRTAAQTDDATFVRERRFNCLDRCLRKLKPEQRDLIVAYYGEVRRQRVERRRQLAASLGITMNALGIRAWRIRAALETCVGACCRSC